MVTPTPLIAADAGTEHRIELRPNCSLSPRGARLFVLSLAATTFGIAGFFAWQGYWPVLPFAGFEIGLLGAPPLAVVPHLTAPSAEIAARCLDSTAVQAALGLSAAPRR